MPRTPTNTMVIALLGALGCGSASDLTIGVQAEAGLVPRPICPKADAKEAGSSERDASLDVSLDSEVDGGEEAGPLDAHFDAVSEPAPSDAGCPDPANAVLCGELKAALVHHYSFDGTGNMVLDSVGMAHGTVVNTQLRGDGTLTLSGQRSENQHVNLPDGIMRQLINTTLEAWVVWNGGEGWQRIFDFGNSGPGGALSTLYLTPNAADVATNMLAAFKRADEPGANETRAIAMAPLPVCELVQVAVVLDDTNNQLIVYKNGVVVASQTVSESLTMLNDVNNWLGRSQYGFDPPFNGTFFDFRIYNVALSRAALQVSFHSGPDATF